MKIGIHGKKFSEDTYSLIRTILDDLRLRNTSLFISEEFKGFLTRFGLENSADNIYKPGDDLSGLDFMITLGGDGTLLDTVTYIRDSEVPILGINTGRMGFLATIAKDNVIDALNDLFDGRYDFDERNVLRLTSEKGVFEPNNFALNDFTILKKDTSSMINVSVHINGEFLNTYWADGIIVATPTGSTGYSMSCGGPLIMPGSHNFVITPVSPHNLTARPIIVPDDSEITFKIEGRTRNFLVSLDSRFMTVDKKAVLKVRKADFVVRLVRLEGSSYFETIRQKLSWGVDIRN